MALLLHSHALLENKDVAAATEAKAAAAAVMGGVYQSGGSLGAWDRILPDLYRLHVRGMAVRGLLEHIHVSKVSATISRARQKSCSDEDVFLFPP